MTKTLSLLLVAAMSIALEAQTPASPQAPDPAMTPGTHADRLTAACGDGCRNATGKPKDGAATGGQRPGGADKGNRQQEGQGWR